MGSRGKEDNTHKLYEASLRGCVTTLNTLIRDDPLILHKLSLTRFSETPLHISALLGHVGFTKALLDLKPQLVKELDSFKRSPLHLASAEGHSEIVKELVRANSDVCLVADQDDGIPLHLAAIRGRVDVIQELIRAKHESIFVRLHESTVLHLCVRYNHLDALKILIVASGNHEEFVNSKDREGKTIFELSIMLKQFKTTSYLSSSVPQIRMDDVNSLMETGLIAALDNHSLDIKNSIIESNLQQPSSIRATQTSQSPTAPTIVQSTSFKDFLKLSNWSEFLKYKNDWFEEARGNLMVVATLIAAMSFQIATNAPGGFWQADVRKIEGCPEETCKAGTSILAYTSKSNYRLFTTCSIFSFAVSLSMILLLISGVPLKNKVYVGLLVIGMWTTIILVAATYIFSISLVQVQDDQMFFYIAISYVTYWAFIVIGIVLYHIIRLCWSLVSRLPSTFFIFIYAYSLLKKLMKLTLKLLLPSHSQRPRELV